MPCRTTAVCCPRIPFLSAYALLRQQVGVGALQAGRHDGFVVVDADMVFGSRLDDLAVVPHPRLTTVVLQAVHGADYRAHVARLDGMNTVGCMVLVGVLQLSLVVGCITACLVVTDDLYA